MYTNANLDKIQDNAPYTSLIDGTKYPSNFPKDDITELEPVTMCDCPTGCFIIGWYIDETYTQVWDTRPYTQEELDDIEIRENNKITAKQDALFMKYKWRQERYNDQTDDIADAVANNITPLPIRSDHIDFEKQYRLWAIAVRSIDNAIDPFDAKKLALESLDVWFPYTNEYFYNQDSLGERT